MNIGARAVLASAALLVAGLSLAQVSDVHMAVLKGKDVSGTVLKRLGLPNQKYCWDQCLKENRCSGTRWGSVGSTEAGQCQLMTGALTVTQLQDMKTDDGQRITIVASRKEAGPARKGPANSGT